MATTSSWCNKRGDEPIYTRTTEEQLAPPLHMPKVPSRMVKRIETTPSSLVIIRTLLTSILLLCACLFQIRLGNLKAQAAKTRTRIETDSAVSVKQIKADVELQVLDVAFFCCRRCVVQVNQVKKS